MIYVTQTGDSLTASGIYYDTLSTINGCDSLIEYDITINNSISIFVVDTACGSYTSPRKYLYSTGTYVDTLQTIYSLIIIDLTIYCDILMVMEYQMLTMMIMIMMEFRMMREQGIQMEMEYQII